jgi:hypothetical protein
VVAGTSRQVLQVINTLVEAQRAEADQEANCARIDAAIRIAHEELAALQNRPVDPHDLHKGWCALCDRTIMLIKNVRRNVARRANEAKETER